MTPLHPFCSIRRLKELIERNHAIPARSIVLLVSGGELLEDESRACHYATGTDTNPIYMFCKTVGESPLLSPGPIKESKHTPRAVRDRCELN